MSWRKKLEYIKGHPFASMWLKGKDKSEITVSRRGWADDDYPEHVFTVEFDNLTYEQTVELLSKFPELKLDVEIHK